MDSSRILSVSQGFALLVLAACVGCSSSSSPTESAGSGSSSGSGSGSSGSSGTATSGTGGGTHPTVAGTGAACTPATTQTVAVQINLAVTWPGTGSIDKGNGPYVLWLLSTYDVDSSNNITATSKTCQLTTPPIALNATGQMASGCTGPCQVGTQSPASEWDKVKRTNPATGVLGGWNVVSSIYIAPAVSLYGLPATSTYADPTTKWPPASAAGYPFGMNPVYTDEEGDSNPGIAVLPITTTGYADIRTGFGAMLQPATDALYIASRTQLSMYGTSTSCMDTSGTADVTLIDNHVIGCDITGGGGACTPPQFGYIDANRTVYVPGTATFTQKVLTAGATCADVVAALPPPS